MKCIRCNTDNNLKDRTANMGRCSSCNHPFAFEPTAMEANTKLTDPFFAKVIADLSANNTLFFTPRQFYYLLDKRLRSRFTKTDLMNNPVGGIIGAVVLVFFFTAVTRGMFNMSFELIIQIGVSLIFILGLWTTAESAISPYLNRRIRHRAITTIKVLAGISLLVGLPLSIIAKSSVGIIAAIVLGIAAILLSIDRKRRQSSIFDKFLIEQTQFNQWLTKWNSINNPPLKILPAPQSLILPAIANPEVTAYSFDRVVVCDRPEIAQLLITNNFHFENNCAILAIDQYPQSIFTTTMEMLRRNPDLKVYALHDCSPQGVQLIHRLRSADLWFPNPEIPIVDVGILPRQILANLEVMIPQSDQSAQAAQQLDPVIRQNLNPEELAWLETGCYLELESFSPQKLIQILQRAINESRELAIVEGGDMLIMDSPGFYTVESFG
jgi:hypothetical protein